MLRTDLVDVINSGAAWAFVASGASIDAGAPGWSDLTTGTVAALDEVLSARILAQSAYVKAFQRGDYPECFAVIEAVAGRSEMEGAVRKQLSAVPNPGVLLKAVADWPFRGYVTTNYDSLLEKALGQQGELGWIPVGNSADEIRKVSADADHVVWHMQGSIDMPAPDSKLVLTERDYTELYLHEGPVARQLQSLLAQNRVVFIGFGFQDAELVRVLKRVGELTTPARPLYAYLPDMSGAEHELEVKQYLDKYNVDVIPYRTVDGSHEQLIERLKVYQAFTVRRSMNYGRPTLSAPSFDAQTTSLLVYNELCLRRGEKLNEDVLRTLMRARVLSQLQLGGSHRRSALMADLDARMRGLTKDSGVGSLESDFNLIVGELQRDGLVDILPTGDDPDYFLTARGGELVATQAATSARLEAQFRESIHGRAAVFLPSEAGRLRIADRAEAFFKDALDQRALGIALTIGAPTEKAKSYHILGLLQNLPSYMEQLPSEDEAIALSRLVQAILARPSSPERTYLGLAMQAQFGVHLLGASPDALALRTRELERTAFLLDSTTLIPFLARSSVGYDSARLLFSALRHANAAIFTTYLLAVEVAEHARWALQNVGGSLINVEGLRAATGRAGPRSNVFLDGLLEEVSRGESQPDLMSYVAVVCGCSPGARTCRDDDVKNQLVREGIPCLGFEEFPGYDPESLVDIEERADEIAKLRRDRGSYRHERQVRAEAEALLLVLGMRNETLSVPDRTIKNAFFLSHTRVIDQVAGGGTSITMRPEAALQWVNALIPCSLEELGGLVGFLLYELVESGIEIVDQARLQVTFAPLINASREKLDEEIGKYRALLPAFYGEHPEKAFRDAGALDVPLMLEGFYAQHAASLEQQIEVLQKRTEALEAKGRFTEAQKEELERLRLEKGERRRKETKRRRAAASRPGKRRRKKKK